MEQYPTWASTLGDRRWNDRWSDTSLEAITKRHSHDREVLAKLAQIDRAVLSATDRLNYDLFKKDYEDRVEGFQYRRYLLPLNQLDGVHTANQLADALRFTTPQGLRRLARAARKTSCTHRTNHRADAPRS